MAQTVWGGVRNAAWMRHPIMIPIAIMFAALAGITPSHIADVAISVGRTITNQVWQWAVQISQSWLLDHWLLATAFCCMVIWLVVRSSRKFHEPDSDCSPLAMVPKMVIPSDIVLPTPKCEKCMVGRILRHNDPSTPLVHSGCIQDGFFRIPLADGDGLVPDNSGILTPGNNGEHCTLCDKHFNLYQQHIRPSTCQNAQCFRIGLPYQTPGGTKYECIEHGKERIILGQMPISLCAKPARKDVIAPSPATPMEKQLMPPLIPPMPPLEEMPVSSPRQNRVSYSSGTVSTGKSLGELTDKLRELGGAKVL